MAPLLNKSSTSFPFLHDCSIHEVPFLIETDLCKDFDNISIVYPVAISKISWSFVNFFRILLKILSTLPVELLKTDVSPMNELFVTFPVESVLGKIFWARLILLKISYNLSCNYVSQIFR